MNRTPHNGCANHKGMDEASSLQQTPGYGVLIACIHLLIVFM